MASPMLGLTCLFLISLVGSVFCVPFKQESSIRSNSLRQQLEDPEDNSSHYALGETKTTEVFETIRAVDLFKSKVSKRIDTSNVILHFPGMKTKLLETAVEKFKLCEMARGSNEIQDMDQSCLGIATAQMMSLINAFEKNPSMHF